MAQTSEETFCYNMANIMLDFVVIQGKLLLKLTKSFGTIITFLDKLLPVILYATFSLTFGKIFQTIWKKIPKIHKIGKIKTIFGLGMTPLYRRYNVTHNNAVLRTTQPCFSSRMAYIQ